MSVAALDIERAQEAARSVVADPTKAACRMVAALVLVEGIGATRSDAAAVCGVPHPNQLSPSQWPKASVTREALDRALVAFGGARTPPAKPKAPATKPAGPRRLTSATKRSEKAHTTSLRRFASADIDPEQAMDLGPDHPALAAGRTIFPKSVVGVMESPRFLVSGHNNPKLGKAVTKGPRTGWPIFQVTLEERATCPRSCPVWAGCYGNAMPYARRHDAFEPGFMAALRAEVVTVARQHPEGLLIRLHTLGDFFSPAYVLMWAELLAQVPQLHVFGYTARRIDDEDPESRKIASAIALLTQAMWGRFAIRTSHAEFGPQRSVVVDADPELPDVIICPAQKEASEACATCGLCWAQAARGKTIAFLRHGMKRGARGRRDQLQNPAGETIPSAQGSARGSKLATGEPPVGLDPPPIQTELATLPLEAIGERLGLSAGRVEHEPPISDRRRHADILHAAMVRLADADGMLTMRRALVCEAAGIKTGSWGYLTAALRDAGRFRLVAPGRKKQASTYQVLGEPREAVEQERPAPPSATPPASQRGVTPQPLSARRQAANRLHATMLGLADEAGLLRMTSAAICDAAGIPKGSWGYLTETLRDAGRMSLVKKGKAGDPGVYLIVEAGDEREEPEPEPAVEATPAPVAEAATPASIPDSKAPSPRPAPEPPRPPRAAKVTPAAAAAIARREDRPQRIKPITEQVLAWCQTYLARGVKLDFLAFCFDLDEDDLAQAVAA